MKKTCFVFVMVVVGAFALFMLMAASNVTYDYGVDKSTTKLPFRTYYDGEKQKRFDFCTVLFTLQKDLATGSYREFTVSLAHLEYQSQDVHRGNYVSELKFSDFTVDDDIQLLPDTIVLVHKDQQGRIIPHETVSHDLEEKPKSRDRIHSYTKVYDAKSLPDDITEEIVCEFLIKGKRERVAFTLPIKKVARYSGYDVLMGV